MKVIERGCICINTIRDIDLPSYSLPLHYSLMGEVIFQENSKYTYTIHMEPSSLKVYRMYYISSHIQCVLTNEVFSLNFTSIELYRNKKIDDILS